MVHTIRRYDISAVGAWTNELQVIDISSLDSIGIENNVAPLSVNLVETFHGFVREGTGQFVTWDGTNERLKILDGTGSQLSNNATLNGIHCVWQGPR